MRIFWWGDFHVANEVEEPLVFQFTHDANADADDDNTCAAKNLSPTTVGMQKFTTISIEGKLKSGNIKSVIYQFWANMIVITVDKFLHFCLGYIWESIYED